MLERAGSLLCALYVFEIVEALTYAVFQTSAVKICGAPGAVPAPPCAENRDRDRGAGVSLSGDDGESEWTRHYVERRACRGPRVASRLSVYPTGKTSRI